MYLYGVDTPVYLVTVPGMVETDAVEPDLLTTLREAIRTSDMSYRRIGKRAGISHVAIIRFMRGNGLQTYTLKRLARVLGYTVTLVPTPDCQEPAVSSVSVRPSDRDALSPAQPLRDQNGTPQA